MVLTPINTNSNTTKSMAYNKHQNLPQFTKSTKLKQTQKCTQMCPDEEFDLRVNNNLVNQFEKLLVNSKVEYLLVKEYTRPAAGKRMDRSLRTVEILVKTTQYLINDVYTTRQNKTNFIQVYEFLFDRFRAIRQDLVIQRCNDLKTINILEVILRFYILADYKLCESSKMDYDEKMNYQHLSEVLFTLIQSNIPKFENKNIYVAIYLLLNMDNFLNLMRALKICKESKKSDITIDDYSLLNDCILLCKYYMQKNYVKVFEISKKLPLICQLALHRRIPQIEISMINEYNVAFSWKNSKFPVQNFIDLTLMNDRQSLQKYIDSQMLNIDNEQNIVFNKVNSANEFNKKINLRERLNHIDKLLIIDNRSIERDFLLVSFNKENASKTEINNYNKLEKVSEITDAFENIFI